MTVLPRPRRRRGRTAAHRPARRRAPAEADAQPDRQPEPERLGGLTRSVCLGRVSGARRPHGAAAVLLFVATVLQLVVLARPAAARGDPRPPGRYRAGARLRADDRGGGRVRRWSDARRGTPCRTGRWVGGPSSSAWPAGWRTGAGPGRAERVRPHRGGRAARTGDPGGLRRARAVALRRAVCRPGGDQQPARRHALRCPPAPFVVPPAGLLCGGGAQVPRVLGEPHGRAGRRTVRPSLRQRWVVPRPPPPPAVRAPDRCRPAEPSTHP